MDCNYFLSKWDCSAAAETWAVFQKNKNIPKIVFCKRRLAKAIKSKGCQSPFSPCSPSHPGAALTTLSQGLVFIYFSWLTASQRSLSKAEVCRDWNLPIWQQPMELSSWLGTCSLSSWKLIPQRAAFAYAKSISKASPAYSAVYHTHMSSNIIMCSQSWRP